jgi:serine/threonine-protein kinase HipA
VDIRPRVLSTAIDMDDPTASIELALKTSDYYGLKQADAAAIAQQVARTVANWRGEAAKLGISAREIERMASAFEHEDAKKALT